jgi:hypothetical protein
MESNTDSTPWSVIMTLTNAERGRRGGLAAQAKLTPEQRAAGARRARLALAVKELVDQAPELTEAQRNRLRVILTQAPSGGGRDGA